MGGGGFTAEPDNPLLDDYILVAVARAAAADPLPAHRERGPDRAPHRVPRELRRQAVRDRAPVAVPARSGPAPLARARARGGHPLRRRREPAQPARDLARAGFDAILREAWEAGIAICGLSAGSMCWFEWGITTSTGAPAPAPGLGWLPGSNTVHYDGEPARRPVYLAAVAAGRHPRWLRRRRRRRPAVRGDRARRGAVSSRAPAARRSASSGRATSRSRRPLTVERLAEPERADPTPLSIAEFRELRRGSVS